MRRGMPELDLLSRSPLAEALTQASMSSVVLSVIVASSFGRCHLSRPFGRTLPDAGTPGCLVPREWDKATLASA